MTEETFAEQMARINALFDLDDPPRYSVEPAPRRDPVCDYSYLCESQCAHCLGHKLDPELEAVVEA